MMRAALCSLCDPLSSRFLPALAATLAFIQTVPAAAAEDAPPLPALVEITVRSTADGSAQKSLVWAPEGAKTKPTPLLVYLHSWGGTFQQKNDPWLKEAVARGWIYLHPDFRGQNRRPAACGSKLARQDVLDAVEQIRRGYRVDDSRLYLAGSSGGGHMSLLMAGHFPERFSAVSAWVGISDLAEWYRFHNRTGKRDNYAADIVASCGGIPGASPAVDAEYRDRSPLFWMHRAANVPLDIAAGVKDGHTGSVPVHHSLLAFNAVAAAGKQATITDVEMRELWEQQKLSAPLANDTEADPDFGRAIVLRRVAGAARVTIFDGGHEGLAPAGCAWLSRQQRKTSGWLPVEK